MREQLKQALKNGVYRALGETATGLRAVNGDGRTLRVLMYHKVNDLVGNRMSMPVSIFDRQMAQLRELRYTVVDLDAVLRHYLGGKPLRMGLDGHDPTALRLGEVQSQVPRGHQKAGAPLPVEMAPPERGISLDHPFDLALDLAQIMADGEQSGTERLGSHG